MSAKIKKRLKVLTIVDQVKDKFYQKVGDPVLELIKSEIQKGNSPVQGGGKDGSSGRIRFKEYSESYSAAIRRGSYGNVGKKLRPINLTLTGEMLASLKTKVQSTGTLIYFTDEKAKYHNDLGAGASKIKRRLLPFINLGERFNTSITKKIFEILKKEIELFTKN